MLAGGASKGAEPVGILSELKPKYDVYIGSSTGSLIALLAACQKWDYLIEAYSTTTNKQMYGFLSPFTKKGKLNKISLSIAALNMLRKNRLHMYDLGAPLMEKVKQYFSVHDYNKLLRPGKEIEVIVTAKCIDKKGVYTSYISNRDEDMYYEKFINFVVASASIPFFAKPREIQGLKWVDGGLLDPSPTWVIDERFGDAQVDVFLMQSKRGEEERYNPVDGPFELAAHLFSDMRNEISRNDFSIIKNPNVRLCYSTYKEQPAANFDPELMKEWIKWGRDRVKKGELEFEPLR